MPWPARQQPVHPDPQAQVVTTRRSWPPATAPSTWCHHTRRRRVRRRPRHRGQIEARPSSAESWADLLSSRASTRASRWPRCWSAPPTCRREQRLLNGGDFLGSAGERLFGFINGQTGAGNRSDRGSCTWSRTGAPAGTPPPGRPCHQRPAQRRGPADVFGDFPTLADPRHADAYSPVWDVQPAVDPKAVKAGPTPARSTRTRSQPGRDPADLLTGVNPATGQPTPYGSVGVSTSTAWSSATPPRSRQPTWLPRPRLSVPAAEARRPRPGTRGS